MHHFLTSVLGAAVGVGLYDVLTFAARRRRLRHDLDRVLAEIQRRADWSQR